LDIPDEAAQALATVRTGVSVRATDQGRAASTDTKGPSASKRRA
jgi:hypothetical protein